MRKNLAGELLLQKSNGTVFDGGTHDEGIDDKGLSCGLDIRKNSTSAVDS